MGPESKHTLGNPMGPCRSGQMEAHKQVRPSQVWLKASAPQCLPANNAGQPLHSHSTSTVTAVASGADGGNTGSTAHVDSAAKGPNSEAVALRGPARQSPEGLPGPWGQWPLEPEHLLDTATGQSRLSCLGPYHLPLQTLGTVLFPLNTTELCLG